MKKLKVVIGNMQSYNKYLSFDQAKLTKEILDNTLAKSFLELEKAFREENTIIFYQQFQSFNVSLFLSINEALEKPKYDFRRPNGQLDGNYTLLLTFICKEILRNESLALILKLEKVNEIANDIKHSVSYQEGNLDSICDTYNNIIISLSNILREDKLKRYLLTKIDNWNWNFDDWTNSDEEVFELDSDICAEEFFSNTKYDINAAEYTYDIIYDLNNEVLGELYFSSDISASKKVLNNLETETTEEINSYGLENPKLIFVPKKTKIKELENSKIYISFVNKNDKSIFDDKYDGDIRYHIASDLEGITVFDMCDMVGKKIIKYAWNSKKSYIKIKIQIYNKNNVIIEKTFDKIYDEHWENV